MLYCSQFVTGYGSGAVYATDQGVVKVEIPDLSHQHGAVQQIVPSGIVPSRVTVQVAQMLQRYFRGERMDFRDIPVFLDGMPLFRQNVLKATRSLDYGEICSYAQVARGCDSPHAARAVGGALASNPVPIIVPCHRVVASDGRLTGFSAPGGVETKRALLQMEGIDCKGTMIVTNQMVMHSIPNK